jgi:hypothetical protein
MAEQRGQITEAEELAGQLWRALEPIHAVVYFSPEVRQRFTDVGLKGFWMGYFAGRAFPLGEPPADVVAATFFNFHPAMVGRAIPDAWSFAASADIEAARLDGASVTLQRLLGRTAAQLDVNLAEAADLAVEAVRGCSVDGRPLYAAHRSLEWPDAPHLRLWHAATLLREHRGDGHIAANLSHGVDGLASHVLAVAGGRVDRVTLQRARGWSDEAWDAAEARQTERGRMVQGQLTRAGAALRERIERVTDQLAAEAVEHLGVDRTRRLIELTAPVAAAIARGGDIPFPNPIGLPRPVE